ncbi:MAG: hypothetical protein WAN51_07765, partial [Alphaproteobacteria bacterium]
MSVRIGCVAPFVRRSARRAKPAKAQPKGPGSFCRPGFVERLAHSPCYALRAFPARGAKYL